MGSADNEFIFALVSSACWHRLTVTTTRLAAPKSICADGIVDAQCKSRQYGRCALRLAGYRLKVVIAQTLLLTVFFVAFAHEGRSASGGRQLRFV